MRLPRTLLGALLVPALAGAHGAGAQSVLAAPLFAPPTVHPIYVSADGATGDSEARSDLRAIAARRRLGPVETLDLPRPERPRAPDLLAAGMAQARALDFSQAARTLREAATEAETTGGDGLDTLALSNLYLYLGMALEQIDWRDLPEGGPPPAPPAAQDAYLRAATVMPERTLYFRDFPPLARHRFEAARAELAGRPRGRIVVKGPSDGMGTVDGRPAAGLPLTVAGLPHGEHFVRVVAPGRLPWAAQIPLAEGELVLDVPPLKHTRLDDAVAAQHARRMAAMFALVVEMKPGAPAQLEVRLIDANTAELVDTTRVSTAGDPTALEAAVMRADERARTLDVERRHGTVPLTATTGFTVAPVEVRPRPEAGPALNQDPEGWAQARWPLLTALGVAVGAALILGFVVALDEPRMMGLQ